MKQYARTRSIAVESPRKYAKPRTEPIASTYSTTAPISDTRSAATIVRNARRNPVSSDERTVLPGAHLVLESFEVDDIGVDGDTDRHDDAGHTGQREREALRAPRVGDEREEDHAGEPEAEPHDEAEQPVEEDHVERDEAEADEPGRRCPPAAGPCRASATRSRPSAASGRTAPAASRTSARARGPWPRPA